MIRASRLHQDTLKEVIRHISNGEVIDRKGRSYLKMNNGELRRINSITDDAKND